MRARKERAKEYLEKNVVRPVENIVNPAIVPSDIDTATIMKHTVAGLYCNETTVGTYLNNAEGFFKTANKARLFNPVRLIHTPIALGEMWVRHEIAKATNTDSSYITNPDRKPSSTFVALSLFAAPIALTRGAVGLVATADNVIFNMK